MAFLNRWDPFTEIARIQDELAQHGRPSERRSTFAPPVDIREDKDAIYLKAELPGVRAEEVDVHVENNVLTLSGERKFDAKEEREGYHRVERVYGNFTRSFSLPQNIAADQVEAELADGILTLKLPKKAEAQPKKVSVRSGNGSFAAKPSQPS